MADILTRENIYLLCRQSRGEAFATIDSSSAYVFCGQYIFNKGLILLFKRRSRFRKPQLSPGMQWLLPYIKPHRIKMAFGWFFNILVTFLGLLTPFITGRIVAEVLQGGQTEKLTFYLLILVSNAAVRAGLRYSQLILFETASQNTVYALRKELYTRVLAQTFGFYDKNRVGDTMARMTGDLEAVRVFVGYTAYAAPESLLLFISATVMMFVVSPILAGCMLLVVPAALFVAQKQAREIRPAFKEVREQFSRLNSVCEENIGGNRVVKAFARENHEIYRFSEANEDYYKSNVATADIWAKYNPLMETCAGIMPVFSLLFGSLLIIFDRMELWQLIMFNGYIWMLNEPTRMFSMHVNAVQNLMTSLDKITEMMRKKIYIQSPDKLSSLADADIKGEVVFDGVSFGYDRNDPKQQVLKNISFKAKAGQTIGIVGPTGAGKTTLVQLIGRFYDAVQGEVKVDGVNVKDYPLPVLRKGIATAMQDVFLFSDTIEGNVAYSDPGITMETVIEASQAADAAGFVSALPERYDTIVGERGVGLSGGQKQRLSLARALAANPAILILDDTTSAVDMETERRIQNALDVLTKKKARTTFIIAHRLLSVKEAGLILVLENGEITERGRHGDLMALGGYYAKLFVEQQGLLEGVDYHGA
jgi:ATP-binding cassette subfamily B protein